MSFIRLHSAARGWMHSKDCTVKGLCLASAIWRVWRDRSSPSLHACSSPPPPYCQASTQKWVCTSHSTIMVLNRSTACTRPGSKCISNRIGSYSLPSLYCSCALFSSPPQIREQNLQDIKTAGPQSQVLCGVVMDRSLVQVREHSVSDISGWWLRPSTPKLFKSWERIL